MEYYDHYGDTLIVTQVEDSDVLELKSQQHLDHWDRDIYSVLIDLTSDPWYRAALRLRPDNPVSSRIKIPISFGANQDVSLFERAMDELNSLPVNSEKYKEINKKFSEYFGPDPHWRRPDAVFDFTAGIKVKPCANFNLPQACRFVISCGLLIEMWSEFAYRKFDPIDMIWFPGKYLEYPIKASNAARFRHDVVFVLFSSTFEFWNVLKSEFQMSKPFVWPETVATMKVPEISELLSQHYPDTDPIFKLCNALEAIVGYTSHYSHSLNRGLSEGGFYPYDDDEESD